MNLVVNGESRRTDDGRTLADLIRDLGLEQRPVAVELNRRIVRKSDYPATVLREGDRVEIVQFVGGG